MLKIKNRHYKRIYAELPDPVVFLPVAASTSGRINEETLRLLFLHANRESSVLSGELPGFCSVPSYSGSMST